MKTVVISDIHIGNNSPTCWYQQKYHEPYLLAILDWILANQVDEFIILGDLFDFWTYPPDEPPPTTQAILDANPNIFGAQGKLSEVITALKGNVRYLHGNHDIQITRRDLDKIPNPHYKIQFADDIYVSEPNHDGVYTHGHLYTMFNAPDARASMPVGHFVTRSVAYMIKRDLKPGQTAADLPDLGGPYGLRKVTAALSAALAQHVNDPSITTFLLDFITKYTGMPDNLPVILPDGDTMTIAQAKVHYNGLWQRWSDAYGGGDFGAKVAAKAVFADMDGDYLAWFAQKLQFERGVRWSVTGHTHVPKQGLSHDTPTTRQYLNSGFECPAVPDLGDGKASFTFSVIESYPKQTAKLTLYQVTHRQDAYVVEASTAPPDKICYPPFEDFSCYVTIENQSNQEMRLDGTALANNSEYVVAPPAGIPAGETRQFWLQDLPGVHGSNGSVTYTNGHETITLDYRCPTGVVANACSGANFRTRSANKAWGKANQVAKWGHPFFIEFTMS